MGSIDFGSLGDIADVFKDFSAFTAAFSNIFSGLGALMGSTADILGNLPTA